MDPRIEALLASQPALERERLRQIEIDAAEALWETFAEQQCEVWSAIGYDGWYHLRDKARKLHHEREKGFGKR